MLTEIASADPGDILPGAWPSLEVAGQQRVCSVFNLGVLKGLFFSVEHKAR